MATTAGYNTIGQSKDGKNRYLPQLPVIEHPMLRMGDKSGLKIRGESPLTALKSFATLNDQGNFDSSHHHQNSLQKTTTNQNSNAIDDNDLPPLRAESVERLLGKKHTRLSTWPGSILDNVPRHKMNASELIQLIREKLPTSYYGIKQAFKAADPYGKGNAPREAIGRILYHLCGYLFPGQVASLLKSLGLSKQKTISFDEFTSIIQDKEISNQIVVLDPVQRSPNKADLVVVEWTATQTQAHLRNRALDGTLAIYDLLPLECLVDNGQILKPQFRYMLESLKINMQEDEFEKLWERCDLQGVGALKTRKLFQKLGIDYDKLVEISALKEKAKRFDNFTPSTSSSRGQTSKKTCSLLSRIARKLEETFSSLITEFQKYDKDGTGTVSKQNFRTVLNNCFSLKLSPIDLEYFLQRIHLREGNSYLCYIDFIKKFQDRRTNSILHSIMTKHPDPTPVSSNFVDIYTAMIAEVKIARSLHRYFISMLEKFRQVSITVVFDSFKKGFMEKNDFRLCVESVLEHSITESEFNELLPLIQEDELRGVDYTRFLTLLDDVSSVNLSRLVRVPEKVQEVENVPSSPLSENEIDEDLMNDVPLPMEDTYPYITDMEDAHIDNKHNKPVATVTFDTNINKTNKETTKIEKSLKEIEELVKPLFTKRFHTTNKSFIFKIDKRRTGKVSLSEFVHFVTTHGISLKEEEARKLFKAIAGQDVDQIKFVDIYQYYTREHILKPHQFLDDHHLHGKNRRMSSGDKERVKQKQSERRMRKMQENAMKEIVIKTSHRFNEIRKRFGDADAMRNQAIPIDIVKGIFQEGSSINLTDEQWNALNDLYQHKNGLGIDYTIMLNDIAVNRLNIKETTEHHLSSGGRSMPRHQTPLPSSSYNLDDESKLILQKIQKKVLPQWKPMRRLLKKLDKNGDGYVPVLILKRLLEEYGVALQDDQFYHILTHFDSHVSGCMSYEEFLRCLIHLDKM